MTLIILPELIASDKPFQVRKETWPENEFIFGGEARMVTNKQLADIPLFDEKLQFFCNDDKDIAIHRTIWKHSIHTDSTGIQRHLITQWIPSHEDLICEGTEWLAMSWEDIINKLKSEKQDS